MVEKQQQRHCPHLEMFWASNQAPATNSEQILTNGLAFLLQTCLTAPLLWKTMCIFHLQWGPGTLRYCWWEVPKAQRCLWTLPLRAVHLLIGFLQKEKLIQQLFPGIGLHDVVISLTSQTSNDFCMEGTHSLTPPLCPQVGYQYCMQHDKYLGSQVICAPHLTYPMELCKNQSHGFAFRNVVLTGLAVFLFSVLSSIKLMMQHLTEEYQGTL